MQELINQSDLYGETIVDTVYRGGNTFIQTIARTVNANSLAAFWPFGGSPGSHAGIGTLWNAAAPIAVLGTSVALALIMTVVAATPAAVATAPTTLTAPNVLLAPGFNGELLFTSRARSVPIRFLCLPTDTGSPVKGTAFTATGAF